MANPNKTATPAAAGTFFGVTLTRNAVIPAMSVMQQLKAKLVYEAVLTMVDIKPVVCAVAQQEGLLGEVLNLVFEYTLTVQRTGNAAALPADTNMVIQKQTIWLPVQWAKDDYKPSEQEVNKLVEKIGRAEEALAGIAAYLSVGLSPDASWANRLAPRGSFETGWHELKDCKVPGHMKPSASANGPMWLNWTAATKGGKNDYPVTGKAPAKVAAKPPV